MTCILHSFCCHRPLSTCIYHTPSRGLSPAISLVFLILIFTLIKPSQWCKREKKMCILLHKVSGVLVLITFFDSSHLYLPPNCWQSISGNLTNFSHLLSKFTLHNAATFVVLQSLNMEFLMLYLNGLSFSHCLSLIDTHLVFSYSWWKGDTVHFKIQPQFLFVDQTPSLSLCLSNKHTLGCLI